jgi:hypothetical protein
VAFSATPSSVFLLGWGSARSTFSPPPGRRPGDRVLIDDGTIEAIVETVADGHFDVVIIRPADAKLKAGKGINLPDTDLTIGGLTAEDRQALAEITPWPTSSH